MKGEGSAINDSQDIERKRSVTSDGLPDGRTGQKHYVSPKLGVEGVGGSERETYFFDDTDRSPVGFSQRFLREAIALISQCILAFR